MKLSSVHAARAVWFMDVEELNPYGKALFPGIIQALTKEFSFAHFPRTAEEMEATEQKGVAFRNGIFPSKGGPVSWDLEIYTGGIAVITRNSTTVSEEILEAVMGWGVKEFELDFNPAMIRKKGYVSHLVFYPSPDILNGLRKFDQFAETLSAIPMIGETKKRQLTTMYFRSEGSDRQEFSFERRAGAPFSENKYFSACDAQTHVHMSLIEEFEKLLSS